MAVGSVGSLKYGIQYDPSVIAKWADYGARTGNAGIQAQAAYQAVASPYQRSINDSIMAGHSWDAQLQYNKQQTALQNLGTEMGASYASQAVATTDATQQAAAVQKAREGADAAGTPDMATQLLNNLFGSGGGGTGSLSIGSGGALGGINIGGLNLGNVGVAPPATGDVNLTGQPETAKSEYQSMWDSITGRFDAASQPLQDILAGQDLTNNPTYQWGLQQIDEGIASRYESAGRSGAVLEAREKARAAFTADFAAKNQEQMIQAATAYQSGTLQWAGIGADLEKSRQNTVTQYAQLGTEAALKLTEISAENWRAGQMTSADIIGTILGAQLGAGGMSSYYSTLGKLGLIGLV